MTPSSSNLPDIPETTQADQAPPATVPPQEAAQDMTQEAAAPARGTTGPSVLRRGLGAMLRGIPTLLVLVALASLAWWGHHHDWRLPKFSELTGQPVEQEEAWCEEHGVPEAECIACNADLMPKGKLFGWCREHGVHECVLEHPELAQLNEPPVVTQEDLDRAARAIAAYPRTENNPACKMHLRRIQFPSIKAVDQAGIDIDLVDRGPVIETIKTTGKTVYDPTRVAHLSSRTDGTVAYVLKNVGDRVRPSDLLALVDAAEVGRLKSQLLEARSQVDLNTQAFERIARLGGSVVPAKKIQEAKAAKAEAELQLEKTVQALAHLGLPITLADVRGLAIDEVRQKLKFLGIPDSVLSSLDASQRSANLIPIVASREGIVVMRNTVAGEVVEMGQPLFTIADTGRMWLLLNLRLEEAGRVSVGQKIIFHPDGSDDEARGTVTWISTEVDRQTRTVQVRGELANTEGRLRNEMYGAGEIVLREEADAILVPSGAVHWEGCCHVVFVRDKDYFKKGSYKVFHTRSVRPGATAGDLTEVIAGLLPGEVVVTKGSGILRAELLKGNLGAG